jgi:aryl-phospho-beta-D-glucosidase BglC (GH1 family)
MQKEQKVKKSFLILSICASIFALSAIPAVSQTLGDVNTSGTIDIVDALLTAQYYVGLPVSNFNATMADVNCSGTIDIVDALLIAQYYVALISTFPCSATQAPTTVPTADPTIAPTTGPTAVPGTNIIQIEAEDYNACQDNDGANQGLRYRPNEAVDLEDCYFGGFNTCWVSGGEWTDYNINVATAGSYYIWARVSNGGTSAATFHINLDTTNVSGTVTVNPTGDWQGWTNIQCGNAVSITAGSHVLRMAIDTNGHNTDYIYLSTQAGAPPARTPVPAPGGWTKPVDTYGQLKVVGNRLCDKNGNPVQLRGMSSHDIKWLWWGKDHTVQNLAYSWRANVARVAMYTSPNNGGYISTPALLKQRVKDYVDDAIEAGIYVIVDWHILQDGDPNTYINESKAFFQEMSQAYGSYPNVIWEICNEPNGPQWAQIKTYANTIIPAIRANDPDNIIVVGTPTWSQDVDLAANDPITGQTNIMYTLHFYAATHTQWLRDKANTAMSKGLALFVTEFGTCDASGNGSLNLTEAQTWLDWMKTNSISWCNWSLCNKAEAASVLTQSTGISGPWTDSQLTQSGAWVKARIYP